MGYHVVDMSADPRCGQFAAESERVLLADFSGQEHRWNCPKANRIDDTNGNRNGCMQLSFQSTRKCLKTIPV